MTTTDQAAMGLAALMAGSGALILLAARWRLRHPAQGPAHRLSGMTLCVLSLALLVGAHQVAARVMGWSPQLPGLLVGPGLVVLVAASMWTDFRLDRGGDSERDS